MLVSSGSNAAAGSSAVFQQFDDPANESALLEAVEGKEGAILDRSPVDGECPRCSRCGNPGGEVIMCETCGTFAHVSCAMLTDATSDEWQCEPCRKHGSCDQEVACYLCERMM